MVNEQRRLESFIEPPITEEQAERGQVISKECYRYFNRLWNEVKKNATLGVSIETVRESTGTSMDLLSKALAYARTSSAGRIEDLANKLIECECEHYGEKKS